ncbi:DUF6624 domain-containing protein [Portibacter marinus]|uniref:DUF6624 domain-containing protein n=1 Tax=Portibacter marinus TaxID=2898660 RepID=UPI001F234EC1|nr:DUF6624 domain-containing protein [Portibacter marinus]
MSFKESLQRNLNNIPPAADVVFVSSSWDTLSFEQWDSIQSLGNYTLDEYVNKEQIVKAFLVRKSKKRDKRRTKKLIKAIEEQSGIAMQNESSSKTEIPSININCNDLDVLLDEIYLRDQGMRMQNDVHNINDSIEQLNQHYIINVIEKCNFPEGNYFNKQNVLTILLVIQHGSKEQRATYFEKFKQAKEIGLLSGGNLATMEDRMLLENNLPQKYGTQLRAVFPGKYEAFNLLSKDSVDFYRKSVGLEPLEVYIKNFNN